MENNQGTPAASVSWTKCNQIPKEFVVKKSISTTTTYTCTYAPPIHTLTTTANTKDG
jgi:hypothetical protein